MSIKKYTVPIGPPIPLLNLPPKREREEEEEEEQNTTAGKNINNNKRARGPSNFLTNRKRKGNSSDAGGKRPKLNSKRALAEQRVEAINKEFNISVGDKEMNKEINLKISSVNVNSLKNPERLKRIGTLIKCWDSDVSILVDTRVDNKIESKLNRNGRKIFATNKEVRGVIISVREALEPKLTVMDEVDSNYLAVTINVQGVMIAILGIYGPNDQSTRFYGETVPNILSELSIISDEMIVAGDLNLNISKSMGYIEKKTSKLMSWESTTKRFKIKDPIEYYAVKANIYPLTYVHTYVEQEAIMNENFKAARLD